MSLSTEAIPVATVDSRRVQRRTLVVLSGSQIMGGFGTVTGISVGVLLAATLAGTAVSGLAQSIAVVGQGLLALPVSRVMASRGRRTGLSLGYGVGAAGAALTVLAAAMHSAPLLFAGLFLFGGASTANYQTRYAAVDLAEPTHPARHLALILWAATLGAVIGPNLASATDALARRAGLAPFSGPFLAGGCAFLVAAVVITLFLRPDPLSIARTTQAAQGCEPEAGSSGFRVALREIAASPRHGWGSGP